MLLAYIPQNIFSAEVDLPTQAGPRIYLCIFVVENSVSMTAVFVIQEIDCFFKRKLILSLSIMSGASMDVIILKRLSYNYL
jgi:hypothetical protein